MRRWQVMSPTSMFSLGDATDHPDGWRSRLAGFALKSFRHTGHRFLQAVFQ